MSGSKRPPHPAAASTIELLEMMLFVNCAKVWKQQRMDGSSEWVAQGVVHPFMQTEPIAGESIGRALFNAYSDAYGRNRT